VADRLKRCHFSCLAQRKSVLRLIFTRSQIVSVESGWLSNKRLASLRSRLDRVADGLKHRKMAAQRLEQQSLTPVSNRYGAA